MNKEHYIKGCQAAFGQDLAEEKAWHPEQIFMLCGDFLLIHTALVFMFKFFLPLCFSTLNFNHEKHEKHENE